MGVKSGEQQLVVAGGVESMSRVPMDADWGGIDGHNPHLRQLHPMMQQGVSGDLIATLEGFSREDCDKFALSNQQRCASAVKEGCFKKSLIPVRDSDAKIVLDHDEYPRPETTLEGLAKLTASFAEKGDYVQKGNTLSFDQKVHCGLRATNCSSAWRESRPSFTSWATPSSRAGPTTRSARERRSASIFSVGR